MSLFLGRIILYIIQLCNNDLHLYLLMTELLVITLAAAKLVSRECWFNLLSLREKKEQSVSSLLDQATTETREENGKKIQKEVSAACCCLKRYGFGCRLGFVISQNFSNPWQIWLKFYCYSIKKFVSKSHNYKKRKRRRLGKP